MFWFSLEDGIDIRGFRISILLYADTIVLLGESEQDLQKLIYCVYNWSKKFKIKFNARKSNIVHFRKTSQPRSSFKFILGNTELNVVEKYKYLGIILNELLHYGVTAEICSDAANQALL